MKITRTTQVAAVAATGLIALAGCSSSSGGTSSSSASPKAGCASGTLSAEGSSAQNNAMSEWIKQYQTNCPDATINYNPTGSGAGIAQFNAGQVAMAGSDSPLNAEKGEVDAAKARCGGNEAWNLPMVVGPIAVAYNLEGVDSIVLNADTIAKIFKGEITKWNDSAIAKLNPDAKLPDTAITVFFRSDESGTTENFTKYLHAAAPSAWTDDPGKAWTGKGEGKEKSAGVQQAATSTPGAITYVEWSYAKSGNLGMAKIDTGASKPVELSAKSASTSLDQAKITGTGNNLPMQLDYTTDAPDAYPIVLVTYEITCSAGLPSDQAALVKSFLTYTSSKDGQGILEGLAYAPLPSEVLSKVQTSVKALQS